MEKKDFSIRIEIEAMLQNIGLELTEEQVGEVIDEVQMYDTFLDVVSLFVAKGIRDVCEKREINYDHEEIEHQIAGASKSINPNDLL